MALLKFYYILPTPLKLAKDNCSLVILIKPQFEVAKNEVGTGGIVRDPALHQRICEEIQEWLELNYNFNIHGVIASSILGAKGNKEFLIYCQRQPNITKYQLVTEKY